MIEFFKLKSLTKKRRLQKVIRLLESCEYYLANSIQNEMLDSFYLKQLFELILDDVEPKIKEQLTTLCPNTDESKKRELINIARHALYHVFGYTPSEWDLVFPYANNKTDSHHLKSFKRFSFKNLFVYAEDIRTPFNIGSIFRTSESFGVEKLFISKDCISPTHAKAKRVAMGATEYLPWEVIESDALPKKPIIALETGGDDINNFEFPKEGIAVIGNEELGISSDLLKKADAHVSIQMYGIKASINVSVAFGILMQKWTSCIAKEK